MQKDETQSRAELDVVGMGNALLDILARCEESELRKLRIKKGTMRLIDRAESDAIYKTMGPTTQMSGGAAANTIFGLGALGASTGFIGKIGNDEFGRVFTHDLHSRGTAFNPTPPKADDLTGRCLVFVTPDSERSMNTCLGAAAELGPEDVDTDLIRRGRILYLEGFLFDQDRNKRAFDHAARTARESGRKIALSLSDIFCVERHHADFLEFIMAHVDILFGNEWEICRLMDRQDPYEALEMARGHADIVVMTRSEKGVVIQSGRERIEVEAAPVENLVDTTGAGDLFASGFLYGLIREENLRVCGELANACAASVLSHMGPRPLGDLRHLTTQAA